MELHHGAPVFVIQIRNFPDVCLQMSGIARIFAEQ